MEVTKRPIGGWMIYKGGPLLTYSSLSLTINHFTHSNYHNTKQQPTIYRQRCHTTPTHTLLSLLSLGSRGDTHHNRPLIKVTVPVTLNSNHSPLPNSIFTLHHPHPPLPLMMTTTRSKTKNEQPSLTFELSSDESNSSKSIGKRSKGKLLWLGSIENENSLNENERSLWLEL